MRGFRALAIILPSFSLLVGCGVIPPEIREPWDPEFEQIKGHNVPSDGLIELQIKAKIYCELSKAVKYVNGLGPVRSGPSPDKLKKLASYALPPDWTAQLSLSLQVDESISVSPGVILTQNLPLSQSRSLGFGGTLSSSATRIDKFSPAYSISYLMQLDTSDSACQPGGALPSSWPKSSPFIVESDLGIQKWLEGAVLTDVLLPSQLPGGKGAGGAIKTDTYSYEIKFVIVSSGNITPTWKLVQVSANASGTFLASGRTRTHDLIITIGPSDSRTLNAHLASEIGQAVNGAVISRGTQ